MNIDATQSEMQLDTPRRAAPDRMAYWRMYGDDWTNGTRNLTLEQRGFYFEILNAMAALGGAIPACERWLGKRVGCDVRVARRLRDSLVNIGKLRIDGGRLVNRRMAHEIDAASKARAAKARRCGTLAPDFAGTSADIFPENEGKSTQPPTPTRARVQDNKPTTVAIVSARDGSSELGDGKHGEPDRAVAKRPAAPPPRFISEDALDRVRGVAPGWDRQFLLRQYLDWRSGKEAPRDPDAAFLGWVKRFTKGRPAA